MHLCLASSGLCEASPAIAQWTSGTTELLNQYGARITVPDVDSDGAISDRDFIPWLITDTFVHGQFPDGTVDQMTSALRSGLSALACDFDNDDVVSGSDVMWVIDHLHMTNEDIRDGDANGDSFVDNTDVALTLLQIGIFPDIVPSSVATQLTAPAQGGIAGMPPEEDPCNCTPASGGQLYVDCDCVGLPIWVRMFMAGESGGVGE